MSKAAIQTGKTGFIGRKFRGSFGKRLYRDREIMNPVLSSKELPWEKKVHKISLKEGVSILMES